MTDPEIAEEPTRYGFKFARRTVVKYRNDQMGIPDSNQRIR